MAKRLSNMDVASEVLARMRFGCCVGIDKIVLVKEAGYDYVELPVGAVMPESPDADFAPVKEQILTQGIRPETWNIMLPSDLKVTGHDVYNYRIQRYLHTAFQRISSVGGELIVFGSGPARRVPEDFPFSAARKQVFEFLIHCAEVGAKFGITVAIEPFSCKDTNMITSLPEAVEFAEALNAPNIHVLVDSYHFDQNSEPYSHIVDAGLNIVHVHTADLGRKAPGTGNYDFNGFFGALKEVGYDNRISIECQWDDFDKEVSPALTALRKAWISSGS